MPFHTAASGPDAPAPTASQKVPDRQETEPTQVSPVTALGLADHDVPSQMSTFPMELVDRQKLELAQDTDWVSKSSVPGRDWSVHDVPFHISARPTVGPPPAASQNWAETQETAKSPLSSGEPYGFAGSGVD